MKRNFTPLLFMLLSFAAAAQNPLIKIWDVRFGGTDYDIITSFKHTSDGGYIVGGYSASGMNGDKSQPSWGETDFWVVKTDASGNKIWDKRFGGTYFDTFYDMDETADGGFILGGVSLSGISGDKSQANWSGFSDFWIVRVDAQGIELWDKRFGGTAEDYLSVVRETNDGGFLLAGYSDSPISGDKTQAAWSGSSDYWVVKTDASGTKLWDKRFGGSSSDYLTCMAETADGGFILGGWSGSGISGDKTQSSQGYYDYWVVKIDALGTKEWDKRFGGTQDEELHAVNQTSDGGYILGGASGSGINGDKTQGSQGIWDYWIVKTNSAGIKMWDKRYGGNGWDHFVHTTVQTTDGGYLIVGSSDSNLSGDKTESNLGLKQGWVVKTDAIGTKVWDKTIKTNGYDRGAYGAQVNDSTYAFAIETDGGIAGYKTQTNVGLDDYWIVTFSDTAAIIILPVELVSFTAIAEEEAIKLSWSTASEQNSKQFEVQRSISSTDNFQTIYTLPAAGNSTVLINYSYNDHDIQAGATYYYRLKQTDNDGSVSYSMVVAQSIENMNSLVVDVYPNPFIETMNITYHHTSESGYASLEIFNVLGEKVLTVKSENSESGKSIYQLKAGDLNNKAGIYMMRLAVNHEVYTGMIILL